MSHFLTLTIGPSTMRDAQCGICLRKIRNDAPSVQHTTADASVVACENSWHLHCMQSWLKNTNPPQCPLCRRQCIAKMRDHNHVVDDLQDAYNILSRHQCPSQRPALGDVYKAFAKSIGNVSQPPPEFMFGVSDQKIHDQAKRWFWKCIVGCDLYTCFQLRPQPDMKFYMPTVTGLKFYPSADALRTGIGNQRYAKMAYNRMRNLQTPLTTSIVRRIMDTLFVTTPAAHAVALENLHRTAYTMHTEGRAPNDLWDLLAQGSRYWALFNISGEGSVPKQLFCIPWPENDFQGPVIGPRVYPGFWQDVEQLPKSGLDAEINEVALSDLLGLMRMDTDDTRSP